MDAAHFFDLGPLMAERLRVLVYAPWSLNGRGPGQTCVWLLTGFPSGSAQTELFAPRARISIASQIALHQSLPRPMRRLPWRFVAAHAQRALDKDFASALKAADPAKSIAYFWPDPPVGLVKLARSLGVLTVREMINTACATSGPILDEAYRRLGLPPNHSITAAKISTETRELRAHDYFFAANSEVEQSLLQLGFAQDQILATSFGWSSDRFQNLGRVHRRSSGLQFLFVGTLNVRKGVPELLEAWQDAGVAGELVLAGQIEPEVAGLLARHTSTGRVRTVGYVSDVGELFSAADVFVFPTHEEGGPQVTYEAAGFGLPVITTSMGAGRIVVDGQTGIVVDAGSVPQLTEAIRLLASREDLRAVYSLNARSKAPDFDYRKVAQSRFADLRHIVDRRRLADGTPLLSP